jgi:hypothetical protein
LPRIALEAKSMLESKDLTLLRDFPKVEILSWKDKQYLVVGRDQGRIDIEWLYPIVQKKQKDDEKEVPVDRFKLPILSDQPFRSAHPAAFEILNI